MYISGDLKKVFNKNIFDVFPLGQGTHPHVPTHKPSLDHFNVMYSLLILLQERLAPEKRKNTRELTRCGF